MGNIKRKGTSGQAKNFITRTQAVRKLQISLPDFRRLCIFKGIYPREPRNKRKASKSSTPSTTFYYTRDIQYLQHEPLLNKFREHKALSKKIARSLGRGEVGDAARLEKSGAGKTSLDHLIKERYPTFIDALRDLDDALSLLFLFANLPSTSTVPPKSISLCQRLCNEFQQYLIVSHSLRKSFLSIKGIYYQATIQGQDILWLVPHKFVQRVTGDIDFRIMGTFVEFYTTLLGFVNFRLYTTIGLIYPPKFNAKSDEMGGELGAYVLEGQNLGEIKQLEPLANKDLGNGDVMTTFAANVNLQKKVDALTASTIVASESEHEGMSCAVELVNEEIDEFEATGAGGDILPQPQISNSEASSLFAPFTFFLSRETPRQPLEFLLRAFGCKRIGWDAVLGDGAFTNNEADENITHQIVDRPPVTATSAPNVQNASPDGIFVSSTQNLPPGYRVPGRTYVQPQWVWDCINEGKRIRPDLYGPGTTLPPHLSPWVKPKNGVYDPSAPLADQEREGEREEFEEEEMEAAALEEEGIAMEEETSGIKEIETVPRGKSGEKINNAEHHNESYDIYEDHGMAVAGSDDSEQDEIEDVDQFDGFEDENVDVESADEAQTAKAVFQLELEAEAAGLPFSHSDQSGPHKEFTPANGKPLRGILKVGKGDEARRRAEKRRKEEEEELQRRMGMMSRKKRKLMEKMMFGKRRNEKEAEGLRTKRRRLERESSNPGAR